MKERLERSLQVCLVLRNGMLEHLFHILLQCFYVYDVVLEGTEHYAVLLGHYRDANEGTEVRTGDHLIAVAQLGLPDTLFERYTLSPKNFSHIAARRGPVPRPTGHGTV